MTGPRVNILIILDTSALIYPFQTGVDFVRGIEESFTAQFTLSVAEGTLNELKRLKERGSPSLSIAAGKALDFARGLSVLRSNAPNTDDQISELAKQMSAAVATGDSTLRRRLRESGIPVIFVSRGKRIRIEGNFPPGSIV